MGRPSYVCATCSEHFTRKHSAKRHNQNLHNGMGEIVRLIDYLAGRSSGKYKPDNPFWYKHFNPYNNIGSTTIPDTIGNSFRPRYLPQQTHLAESSYPSENHVIADTAISSRPETLLQAYPLPTALPNSQTPAVHQLQKLDELELLLSKFGSPDNAYVILELAKYNLRQGDEGFLNERLQQFRTLDRQGWRPI
jgi:hypothetical protein